MQAFLLPCRYPHVRSTKGSNADQEDTDRIQNYLEQAMEAGGAIQTLPIRNLDRCWVRRRTTSVEALRKH